MWTITAKYPDYEIHLRTSDLARLRMLTENDDTLLEITCVKKT